MRHTFFCIDGHTAGNPVRLVVGGHPPLGGESLSDMRQQFMAQFDWIRKGLMFEPRGHDMMSGGFIYPAKDPRADFGVVFIETSGCLPMCGHGSIGIITFGLEHGLITPKTEGRLVMEAPAGLIEVEYQKTGAKVEWVKLRNVPSYLAAEGIEIEVPGFGPLTLDVAYGGNYYAIVDPQPGYGGLDSLTASDILRLSPQIRAAVQAQFKPVHPLNPAINGVSHVLWADKPASSDAHGRNAVFYGDKAIDRSPCGTGTSARMAQLAAKGVLKPGDIFIHESYIKSRFIGRVEAATELAGQSAIIPSIQGTAYATGFNQIWIDDQEPFPEGFLVV
ncbi:MAG: 4-hydroxyproline epimerase [Pseudomonadota bacterium]|uniref:4-hydroxyproline epimerase n=1 Tax=Gallaecimonas pentaromativorans TaxID=584787 RepID=UPI00067F0D8D|nr:4-hydroxyproline epimerase [Gallaecimonas pentaromativorans]MED5526407.1 4-hydroxyproline epimerase [Pseudomonadota bacterium]